MVKRVHLEAGRFILSRPTFDVSTSMPDSQKIVDSEWGYAGNVIASGIDSDPAPVAGGASGNVEDDFETQGSQPPWEIPFPDPGYIPTVLLQAEWDKDLGSFGTHKVRTIWSNWLRNNSNQIVRSNAWFTVHRGFIRMERGSTNNPGFPSRVRRFQYRLVWTVFGFGNRS